MSSKERVLRACKLLQPDNVPVDFWAEAGVIQNLLQHFQLRDQEELLQQLHVDVRYVPGADYTGPPLLTDAQGVSEDIWGVRRQTQITDSGASYKNALEPPLARAETVADVENYDRWPNPDWFDYSRFATECEKHSPYGVVFSGGRLNRTAQLKAAMYLRGMQQIMEDMICNPELLTALLQRITDFYLEYNRRIFKAADGKLDIFMMGDDFGMQNSLITSADMWRQFFKPNLKKFIDLAKEFNILVMHHTCGAVEPIIPDFIEIGLDILNPIQPEAVGMDAKLLKQKYGKYIAFHGGVSIQKTLPYGSPADVKAEVEELVDSLAEGGGYILCTAHNIQEDVPLENIEALFAAYERYR